MKAAQIGFKAGKIINCHKMSKHFVLKIEDDLLAFERNPETIRREADIDGIYIVRTSERADVLSAENAVRTYKSLGQVEQAFRCMKSIDLQVRPIRHRTEAHVRGHIFLCMLAYYVQWHMRKALSSVLFHDDELDADRWTRHAVAKAEPSQSVKVKKRTKTTTDGWPVHSLGSLLNDLATRCRNTCRSGDGTATIRFDQLTEPTPFQRHVFELLKITL
jgi:transposase